ncbi:hypothetical protein HCN51_13220 [Nonomuraea sp. FMUSA5-5]|uniref:Uncharacterized protein n=1 Tax=Nonomuraea composti TaxID=2720023 RepID=A0ABX1B1N9_9ACTN|nr:hypothetical protein [Nonomuraea sp. FMUSA5-5]NJP90402.1 hypothetical protein [Nonomuraea sp. FMUSA5-5]
MDPIGPGAGTARVLEARRDGDAGAGKASAGSWHVRLQRLPRKGRHIARR